MPNLNTLHTSNNGGLHIPEGHPINTTIIQDDAKKQLFHDKVMFLYNFYFQHILIINGVIATIVLLALLIYCIREYNYRHGSKRTRMNINAINARILEEEKNL